MIPLLFLAAVIILYVFRKHLSSSFPLLLSVLVFIAAGVPVLMAIPPVFHFPHPIPVLSFYAAFLFLVPFTFFAPQRFTKARVILSLYFHFLIAAYWLYPFEAMWVLSAFASCLCVIAAVSAHFILFSKVPVLRFRLLTIVAVFALLSGVRVASFVSTTEDRCDAITDSRFITPLFTYCDPDWGKTLRKFYKKFNARSCQFRGARFAVPSRDARFVYLGTGGCDKMDAFMKYDRKKRKIVKMLVVKDVYSVHENMKPHLLFVSAHPSSFLYLVDADSFKIKKIMRTPGAPMFVETDEKLQNVFLGFEHDPNKLQILDLKTLRETKKLRVIDISAHYMAYNPVLKILYFAGRDGWNDYLVAVDAENYERLSIAIPSFAVGITLDVKKKYVYMAFPMKGLIGVYDAQNLAPVRFIKAGFGVRELAFDENSRKLYAGNYITGKIKVFNMNTDEMEKEFFAGMRIRRLIYSEKLRRLFVANANGFLEVNPDKL